MPHRNAREKAEVFHGHLGFFVNTLRLLTTDAADDGSTYAS
jgi:hypothetical protein